MGRRLAIASLLATLAVVAFVVLFVRSGPGGARVCALAEATLREATKGRVVIGACHLDPISAKVVIDEVELGPEGHPLVAAERISAGLLGRALLEGRVRIEDVEIVRPRVNWAQLAPAAEGAPKGTRESRGCLPSLGRLEVGHVSITGADLRLELAGGRSVATTGLDLAITGAGHRLELGIETARTEYADETTRAVIERFALKANLDLATGAAKVTSLDVSAREGSLFAQGDLSNVCEPRGEITATVRLDLGRLGAGLLASVPHLGGLATVRARVKLEGTRFDATADLQAKDTTLLSLAPGSFDATLRVTNDVVTVTKLDLPLTGGRARLTGQLKLARPFDATFDTTLENASLGDLLVRVGVKTLPVHMVASGAVRVSGPLVAEDGMHLAGQLDLKVPEFAVLDRTWQERAGALRWAHLDAATLRGGFTVLRDRLLVRNLRAAGGGTIIDASGTAFFDAHKGMRMELGVPSIDFADLGPFGPTRVTGRGAMSGSVEGPYRTLDMKATAQLRDLNVLGLELGTIATAARLDLGAKTIDLEESRGLTGGSTYRMRAHLDYEGTTTVQADLGLVHARVGDLIAMARGMVPSLAPLAGKLEAVTQGTIRASGPLRALDVDADLKLTDVLAWGQAFPTGTLTAGMKEGKRALLKRLELRRGDGYAALKGSFAFDTKRFSGSIFTEDLRVADLDALHAALPKLAGGVTLRAKASGTLDAPTVDGRLTLRDWMLGDQPLATVRLGVDLHGRDLVLDGTAASPWLPGVKPPPRAPDEPYPLPPGSMFHTIRMKARLEGAMPFELQAKLDLPSVAAVLAPGVLGDGLEGGAAGTLTAKGDLARPLGTHARFELSRLWARKGATRLENSGPAIATFEDGRLVVQTLPIRGDSFELDAFGTRELDGQLDLTVQGGLDLAILPRLVPGLDDARGRVGVEVSITGSEKAPVIVGNATLDDVGVRPSGGVVELTDGRGGVSFSPEAVIVDGFTASLNGGPLSLSGQLELDHFKPQRLELRTELGEIPLRVGGIPLVVAGSPSLAGKLDALTLSGDVEIVRFRYDQPFDLEKRLTELVMELRRGRPPTPKVFSHAGEFLTMDLGVRLGDVRVDNNILKAELKGDVRVTGTNRRPGLLGAVTLADAKAFVRNVEYQLSSGVVNFTDRTRIRPAFDVRAEAKVREYLVHIAASGTLQQQRLLLSSEPSLPYADLMMLLAFGVTSRDVERAGSASLGGVAFDAASNYIGLNDQLRRLLPETEIFKDPRLRVTSAYSETTGNIEPVAQFESKVSRDDIRLRGQTSIVGGRGGRRAQLEWRIDENTGVQLQWDADNPAAPTTGDLGGDVVWHAEWP